MTREKCQNNFGLISLLFLILSALLLRLDSVAGTNLMKIIRERQNSESTMLKDLDMSDENWIYVPQPVQDVLTSIDDKLSLYSYRQTLKLAQLDFSLEQLLKRMESIEMKLDSLETKIDLRVEEVGVNREIKEEFSNENMTQRMESLNEKVNNKAAYLGSKLDRKSKQILNKLELLENSIGDITERLMKNDERHAVLENEMLRAEEKVDELCINVNEHHLFLKTELLALITKNYEEHSSHLKNINSFLKVNENKNEKALTDLRTTVFSAGERMLTILQESHNRMDNISAIFHSGERSRSPDLCEVNAAVTQEQLENLTTILEKALTVGEAKLKELDSDVELYTKKVINGIQELWKTSDELKLDLSNTLEQGSKTRDFVRKEFQKLHEQIKPLPKLEPKLSNISEDIDKKVVELSNTVDNSFSALLIAQNAFIDSCQQIQHEGMLIYDILQQIVYEMRNRSIADIHRISSELHTQSLNINKSLATVLTTVLLTGNITTNAMNALLEQLKQRDQCLILKTENINWKTMESICSALEMESAQNYENKNVSEERYASQDATANEVSAHSAQQLESDHFSSKDTNENDKFHINDYDKDYQLSEAEYKEFDDI